MYDNGSVLPGFSPKTDASLSHKYATRENIVKIINNSNSKNAHGFDGIAVSMLQLCVSVSFLISVSLLACSGLLEICECTTNP